MAALAGFFGPTNALIAPAVDAEKTINLFLDTTTPGIAKAPAWWRRVPGLAVFTGAGLAGPIRGEFAQDGRAFVVAGTIFSEIFADRTQVGYGLVLEDANPATIVSNGTAGHQLLISSGGRLYVFDLVANTLTWLDPGIYNVPNPCAMVEFMDGYGLALKTNSRQFQISALEDFTTWDPLDVAERSEGSDDISALIRSHREIWLIGTKTTEVWTNTGEVFPFAPNGVFIEQGCPMGAGYTAQRLDNSLAWLSQNENGAGLVLLMDGYSPKRISTAAIDEQIRSSSNLGASRAWAYQDEGHLFYLLLVNDLPTTLVYDVAMSLWHERGHWDTTLATFSRGVPQCHMYAFGKHLVGDRVRSRVYEQSLAFQTDELLSGTTLIRGVRRFPLPYAANHWITMPRIEVVLQPGLGLPSGQGSNPQVMLSLSRDGGKTFGDERMASAGPQGHYTQRVYFYRNGRYRNGYAQVALSDPAPWYLVGCEADVMEGTS